MKDSRRLSAILMALCLAVCAFITVPVSRAGETLSDEQQKAVGHFYFRGGFDYDRIKGADKIMISLLRSSMQKKKNPTEGQKALLSAFETADHTDRKNIAPLIEHVKGL